MIQQLDLTDYSYVFSGDKLELSKKNFIYGRNGTGKTSITSAIKNQYADTHNVCVFNGYQNVFKENDSLDTFSLGEERGEQNKKLIQVERKINNLNKELMPNPEKEDNLYSRMIEAEVQLEKEDTKIDKLAITSASLIKNISEPKISISSYNKSNFYSEIKFAKAISNEEIKKCRSIILSEETKKVERINIEDINLIALVEEVNDVLEKELKPSIILKELEENGKKQQFARTGLKLHRNENSEGIIIYEKKCAFCNSELTNDRIQQLDSYFSDAVDKLEVKINNLKEKVKRKKQDLNNYENIIDTKKFHATFKENLDVIINKINLKTSSALIILDEIEGSLVAKENSIFEVQERHKNIKDISFKQEREKYAEILKKNNTLIKNIENEKEKAREKIRFDKINTLLEEKEYHILKNNQIFTQGKYEQLEEEYRTMEQELKELKNEHKNIISQFDTEMDVVNNINNLLEGLGNQSIRLDMIKKDGRSKGSYWIRGHDGKRRPLKKLSEGEKNLIAFLYFIYKINDVNSTEQDKIIVFDDPVTSNDSTTQYLIIGVIKTFYAQQDCPQFVILSHNQHFFIQVLPNSFKNKHVYHLKKNTNSLVKSEKIANSKQLSTLYTELWIELAYAYEKEKNAFMWNVMRRILETFVKFYYNFDSVSELNNLIADSEGKSLMISLIKSLHVNSHLALETEIDIRAHTPKELLIAFEDVFDLLNIKKHYDVYWRQATESLK